MASGCSAVDVIWLGASWVKSADHVDRDAPGRNCGVEERVAVVGVGGVADVREVQLPGESIDNKSNGCIASTTSW